MLTPRTCPTPFFASLAPLAAHSTRINPWVFPHPTVSSVSPHTSLQSSGHASPLLFSAALAPLTFPTFPTTPFVVPFTCPPRIHSTHLHIHLTCAPSIPSLRASLSWARTPLSSCRTRRRAGGGSPRSAGAKTSQYTCSPSLTHEPARARICPRLIEYSQ